MAAGAPYYARTPAPLRGYSSTSVPSSTGIASTPSVLRRPVAVASPRATPMSPVQRRAPSPAPSPIAPAYSSSPSTTAAVRRPTPTERTVQSPLLPSSNVPAAQQRLSSSLYTIGSRSETDSFSMTRTLPTTTTAASSTTAPPATYLRSAAVPSVSAPAPLPTAPTAPSVARTVVLPSLTTAATTRAPPVRSADADLDFDDGLPVRRPSVQSSTGLYGSTSLTSRMSGGSALNGTSTLIAAPPAKLSSQLPAATSKDETDLDMWGSRGPVTAQGIPNQGNTCFMNSALQCLAHTPQLMQYFLAKKESSHLQSHVPSVTAVASAFGCVIREMWSSSSRMTHYRDLKAAVEKVAPMFRGYEQHDSHEFLRVAVRTKPASSCLVIVTILTVCSVS
eukprot:TRINITY_DN6035_c0_g1_i1.p1 TRINITY_DN6035_c0_g1~~TRINITY_DN6035_c0_g1_i1.p1  ORF type:complete len:415 (-),score=74.87 TRINITY_DN6035_c0_g1_i1:876-2051(-)